MKTICIYHGNCADGFASAWVVRKALGEANVEFVAGVYGTDPPDVADKDVIIVDFSYKLPVMEPLIKKAKTVLILDHHKTAQEDLASLVTTGNKNVQVVFDMDRSGCRITWDHFFDQEPPQLLLHIEDRDLWRFKLPMTREIQATVFSYPYEFDVWDGLMQTDPVKLAIEGKAIERKHFKDIDELLGVVTRPMSIDSHHVMIANLPYTFSSDAGHKLAQGMPFGGCYYDTPEGRCFSLRSTNEGIDVSEVAKKFGGGGHRNAAGFMISFDKAKTFEMMP